MLKKYERVCFERDLIRLYGKPMASLIHPGHPLMSAITDLIIESHATKLKQGAVFLDPADESDTPKVIIMLDHAVRESSYGRDDRQVASRRMQFVAIDAQGRVTNAGWAPHLDLEPLSEEDTGLIQDILQESWLSETLEQQALDYAAEKLVPEHYQEIKEQRERQVQKTLNAVNERLTKEIEHWQDRYFQLKDALEAGQQPRMQPENAKRRAEELRARLEQRTKELMAKRNVASSSPVAVGGALVIPAGLLAKRKGQDTSLFSTHAARRRHIEHIAMQKVFEYEQASGYITKDVSAEKCGWDISAYKTGCPDRHIEVKGRAKGQNTITVTRNEIMYALNQEEKFWLAVVFVDEEDHVDGPYYVYKPFKAEPDWGVASLNYDVQELLG